MLYFSLFREFPSLVGRSTELASIMTEEEHHIVIRLPTVHERSRRLTLTFDHAH
ncbi:unnamed protein product [Echinostoma caproni]|uniref:Uncharacterized protein n=1 Tax=Echinostoma caproni TaxID=27848 RepID=A0A183BG82_9TREM|nr:unnamed protein product [Echinostoma caproni]